MCCACSRWYSANSCGPLAVGCGRVSKPVLHRAAYWRDKHHDYYGDPPVRGGEARLRFGRPSSWSDLASF